MKRTYHNHDIEDYIDYHDIRYILHITSMYVRVNACMKVADPLLITSKISKTIICKIRGNLSV